jgi:transcriptional regulator with XRE-family HTH domain
LNISQTDFAESLGISFGYLNMLINGRRKVISLTLALLIEKIYGYSAFWLLEGEGEKKLKPLANNNKLYTQTKELVSKLSLTEIQLVLQYIDQLEKEDEQETQKKKLKKQKCP